MSFHSAIGAERTVSRNKPDLNEACRGECIAKDPAEHWER